MAPYWKKAAKAAVFVATVGLALASCQEPSNQTPTSTDGVSAKSEKPGQGKIDHVVVIYLENRSFDNTYGDFQGAEGRPHQVRHPQIDANGHPYDVLPQVAGSLIPVDLRNQPFGIEQYVAATQPTIDLVHRFYQEQQQIDGGLMDKFALVSDAKGLSMGFYRTAGLPLAAEAANYTLCDNFFHAAFGGSFLNHQWLIAARSPVFHDAPSSAIAQLDAAGNLIKDGFVTPDGYVVNTSFSVNLPHPSTVPIANLVPNQTHATIGDRLSAAGVSWAWYSGGWNDALAGNAGSLFQFHHQPFIYFKNFADGTEAKANHLKDELDFIAAATAGRLPAVSFVKPYGTNNEHPGYTDVITGENHVKGLIDAVRGGPNWASTAIIITYDENGGFWDHVSPPRVDRWGPGSRVPALIISPFAKKHHVDHRRYDTTSILAFIEARWGLKPLTERDAQADPLSGAFQFGGED